jgi:hypothetical protein
MMRPFTGFRGRRPLFVLGIALDTALISLVMSGLGATPAAALTPPGTVYGTTTQTGWLPLQCNLNGTLTSGIPVHIGVALRATFPATVIPGQKFAMTNVTSYQVQPGAAQFAANSFNAEQVAGTVTQFEQKLTNASGGFAAPDNGTLVNQVRALQPPNTDAPSPVDPLVDPQAGNPAPGQWWTDLSIGDTAERHNVFEFGGIPIDTSSPSAPTAYGPTPGTGGGTDPNLANDGVADPIQVFPFNVTGAAGQTATMDVGDASRQVVTTDGSGDFIAESQVFFRSAVTHTWETTGPNVPHGFPTWCGKDATSFAVPPASPGYCTSPGVPAGCFVHNFQIPIVNPQGLLRVTSNPAVPTQILVDGNITDSWGLVWMKEAAGSHTVCFAHVDGWTEPPCQTVSVSDGATTTVTGNFTQRGSLRVLNSPAVASAVSVDGNPTNEYGMWTDIPTGAHQVCWGAVAGWTPPPCQNITLTTSGMTVTGNFTACGGCTGQTGVGLLRVTTNPAVPSQITLQKGAGPVYIADHWSLTWLEVPGGSYTVCFSHVIGWTEPACQTVTVTNGLTTTVQGNFTQRGFLRVLTTAGTPATVYVEDIPRNDWGDWTDYPTGAHTVCYGAASGYARPPACVSATVNAGATTTITGTYN